MYRFGVVGLVLVVACGDSANHARDAAIDTPGDARVDAVADGPADAPLDAEPDASPLVRSLVLTTPAGRIAAWSCVPLTFGVIDGAGAPAPLLAPVSVTAVTSSASAKLFVTAADCWANAPSNIVQLAVGSTGGTIYYRADVAETATILLISPIGSPTANVTSVALEVFGQPDTRTVTAYAGTINGWEVTRFGNRLLVVNDFYNRVLVLNSLPTQPGTLADFAIGQPSVSNISTMQTRPLSGATLHFPKGAWSDGTRLVVADTYNDRVLVWNQFPTTDGQSADFALGQPPGPNNLTQVVSPSPTPYPTAVTSDGTKLVVASAGVRIWNTFPTAPDQPPDVVLGGYPDDFARDVAPDRLAIINGALYVTDSSRHRVMVWSSIPTVSGAPADYVLGQPAGATNFTSIGAGCAADRVTFPGRAESDGTRLFLPDGNRVLVWNTIPTTGGAPADFALGVPPGATNLTECSLVGQVGALLFGSVSAVVAAAGKLLVQDGWRLLVWNTAPTAAGVPADFAADGPPGPENFNPAANTTTGSTVHPASVVTDGVRTLEVDTYLNRVLVWTSTPRDGEPAAFALGQPPGADNLRSWGPNWGGRSGSTLNEPQGVYGDGTRLFVADSGNHRVLVWNTMPTNAGQPADFALGQPPGPTNLTDDNPTGWAGTSIASDGTRLFVGSGNAVYVWNAIPTSPTAPDVILGGGASGTSGSTMVGPTSVGVVDGKLCVADPGNHRVLIWNTIPTASGTPASFALGQPPGPTNLTSSTYAGTPSGEAFAQPVACSGRSRLYVVDSENHRVLVWPTVPSSPVPATQVIGQPDLVSGAENRGEAVSRRTLWGPTSVWDEGGRVLIADYRNMRILVVPAY